MTSKQVPITSDTIHEIASEYHDPAQIVRAVSDRGARVPSEASEATFVEPRNDAENRVARIWCEVLACERVGVHDNFFDKGGTSMLLVRLHVLLTAEWGREAPLMLFFQHPTIEEQARLLCAGEEEIALWEGSCLFFPIQSQGTQPPLFLLPPLAGAIFTFFKLAHLLGKDQPVYGIQDLTSDFDTIEAMGAYYAELIKTVQPSGPYYLGGWSFGAYVAYELARRLTENGDQVDLLIMFDTPPATLSKRRPLRERARALVHTLRHTRAVFKAYWGIGLDHMYLKSAMRQQGRARNWLVTFNQRMFPRLGEADDAELAEVLPRDALGIADLYPSEKELFLRFLGNQRMLSGYTTRPYSGRVTLFRCTDAANRSESAPDLGWSALAEDVDVRRLPGNHVSMLREPNVFETADQLRTCLRESRDERAKTEDADPLRAPADT